jgi:glycosyltransferase domain-containing protein
MSSDSRVTILLTLKGRDLYTLRWLWHANRVGLPFPVVIADGDVNLTVARLIEEPATFPNLKIAYRRYNDRSFSDFYLKLRDAVASIETPYVMMSDNDDFLCPSGIIESANWLQNTPAYVSAGGAISHFEAEREPNRLANLSGKIQRYWYQQSRAYRSYDLDSQSAAERVSEAYSGFLTVWYNVFRTETLRDITNELVRFNFQRLDNSELWLILRTATLGKVKSHASCISYVRQLGTSSNPARGKDFVDTVSNSTYVDEIQKIAKYIGNIAAELDGAKAEDVIEKLNAISAARLRGKLIAVLGWRASVKRALKTYMPLALTVYAKGLLGRFRSGKSSAAGGQPILREDLLQQVARSGASAMLLDETKRELADIERTMESGDFIAFVEANAPELLRQHELA